MRSILSTLLLLALFAFQTSPIKLVNPKEFAQKLKSEKGVLLDIRTPGEYRKGHLEGSTLLDFFRDDFEKQLDQLDKKTTYFIYCGIGGRSEECSQLMLKKGFKKVYDLNGGISRWIAEGLPVIK